MPGAERARTNRNAGRGVAKVDLRELVRMAAGGALICLLDEGTGGLVGAGRYERAAEKVALQCCAACFYGNKLPMLI